MKQWILHIWMIGLLMGIGTSCTSIVEDETDISTDEVTVNFTLSMGTDSKSRATAINRSVNDFENSVDVSDTKVLLYDADNTLWGEVKQLTLFQSDAKNVYHIVGKLEPKAGISLSQKYSLKVVVLTNCGNGFNNSFTSLGSLTYDYSQSKFNPSAPQNYIPMWGIKSFAELQFTPGSRTDLGTIGLLRAMAKVAVNFIPEEGSDLELSGVTLDKCYSKGTCVPGNYAGISSTQESWENGEISTPTVPSPVPNMLNELAFFKVQKNQYLIYIPEIEVGKSKMKATVDGKVYDIEFKDYATDTRFPVVRNHSYLFNAKLAETQLELSVNVSPWNKSDESMEFTNAVTYTRMEWADYKEFTNNEVLLNYEVPVKSTFRIEFPEGARWYVSLSNSNIFMIDGESHGVVAGTSGSHTHDLRIKPKDWNLTGTYETSIRVYVTLPAGDTVELDMISGSGESTADKEHFKVVYSR